MYCVAPQREASADMISKLGHEERLAYLGRSGKEVSTGVEQTVNDRRAALVNRFIQLTHGYGM